MPEPTTRVAFTPSVLAIQERKGSREAYAKFEQQSGGWKTVVTPRLAEYLAERDSFYLATASAAGQPYVQHRGGPPGFLKVLDERTLAFADFRGNLQYITQGNLVENDRANEIKMQALSILHEEAMKSFSRGSKAAADFVEAYSKRVSKT